MTDHWTYLADDELRHRLVAAGMLITLALVAVAERDTPEGMDRIDRWLANAEHREQW